MIKGGRASYPRVVLLLALLAVVAGCDTLGPLVGSYKNTLESIVGVTVAGTYTIEVKKDNQILVTETWTCTTDGTKLTGCHKTGSLTTSTDVVPPKM